MIDANGFTTRYGRGLAPVLTERLGSYLVIAQPEPWAVVEASIGHRPVHVEMADDLSPDHLDHLANTHARPRRAENHRNQRPLGDRDRANRASTADG